MRYRFIRDNTRQFPVRLMCRTLRLRAAGYYRWLRCGPGQREVRRLRLVEQIRVVHACSRGTYGSPRVHRELVAQGEHVCENTVAKVMRQQQIRSKVKRRFRAVRTTDSDHQHPVAANLLDRNFTPPGLDQSCHHGEGVHRHQPSDLLVPDLPPSDARHGPQPSEHSGPVGVDGERAAVVPLEPTVPA